jgi:ribonuclease Z
MSYVVVDKAGVVKTRNVTGCVMLQLKNMEIGGVSIAGIETCIELPSWKLCFDLGKGRQSAVRFPRILFTHGHSDHMGGIVSHCATRSLMGMKPPDYYVPAENLEAVQELFTAWRRLDGSDLPCNLHPVAPGDRFDLGPTRFARVFRSIHRVPTLGYGLFTTKNRLRSEFSEASPDEIRQARQNGQEVSRPVETCEIAFCGDTTIEVLRREVIPRTARVLVLEMSFLDDRVSAESAAAKGHIHLDDVIEHADLFENEVIVASHFSARYRHDEVRSILGRRLPASLKDRVIPLLPS